MLLACTGCSALAVLLALRWVLHRVDALGRRRPFPTISIVTCLLVASGVAVPLLRHDQLDDRLAAAATQLVGTPVSVHCQTLGQAWTDSHTEAGYVMFGPDGRPQHATTLSWQTCSDLTAWLNSDRAHPSLPQVVAVHVVTHESMHMAGQPNEARAECSAVQRDVRTAELLGATPQQARDLAVTYWQQVYPLLAADYRTPDCAMDQPLDEHGPDAPWRLVKTSENS